MTRLVAEIVEAYLAAQHVAAPDADAEPLQLLAGKAE
jgi:hypothetical protein